MAAVTIGTVLAHLPTQEAQKYIFSLLDFNTLKSARRVNKQWQRLVDPLMEFHVALSDRTKSNVKKFGSDRKVTTLSTTKFEGLYPRGGIKLKTQNLQIIVKMLDDPESLLKSKKKSINKSSWQNSGISEKNFWRLIRDFWSVKKLHVASVALKTFSNPQRSLTGLHMPNVTVLVITFFDSGFHQLLHFMKNFFPSLRKVSIANIASRRRERTTGYSWIFGFLARHSHLLEDVTLIFPEGIRDDEGDLWMLHNDGGNSHRRHRRPLPPIKDHKMPQVMYELAKSKLEKLQLKRFIWDLSMMEGTVGRFDMGTTLLMSQTKLGELHLDNLRGPGPSDNIWSTLAKVLENCSETLTALSIGGCFCSSATLGALNTFNCSWVKSCKSLKSLEVVICGMHVQNIEDLPKSISSLNLGHLLSQQQIEYVALRMVNLETWVLPQKGSLINHTIPRISVYLFKAILHLPKLKSLSVYTESADAQDILDYVATQEGIDLCHFWSVFDTPRGGDMTFHIRHDKFSQDHGQLQSFLEINRPVAAADANNNNVIIEQFVRYLFQDGNIERIIALVD